MRLLIRADLRRVLRKPDGIAAEYLEMTRTTLEDIGLPFLCIPIFLAVYGDEFKSGTLQCVIGRGLSRPKVVIAKLLDAAILLTGAVAAVFLVIFIRNSFSNLAITPRQNLHFLYVCIVCVLRGVGYMALSCDVPDLERGGRDCDAHHLLHALLALSQGNPGLEPSAAVRPEL